MRISIAAIAIVAAVSSAHAQQRPAAPRAPAGPVLRIANSSPDGIEFTRADPKLEHTFRIVATNAFSANDLVAWVEPFRDDAGRQFPVTSDLSSTSVALDRPAELRIAATLGAPGVYTTEISLAYSKTITVTRLTVVRTGGEPAPVEEIGVEPVGSSTVRGERSLFGDPVWIELRLREVQGRERSLALPTLERLERKSDDGEMIQTTGRLRVLGPSGRTGDGFTIPPRGDARLALELHGLREAGRYEGSVRFTAQGTPPLDVPFAITIKDSGWIAALFIALGVVASHLLRLYFRRWRRRLVWRRDLARLRERLAQATRGAPVDERDREVIAAVRRHLDDLADDIAYEVTAELEDAMRRLATRIDLVDDWLRAKRRVARLAAGERTRELRRKLDDVADALGARGATADDLGDAARLLAELDVRAEERAELDAAIAAFEQLVADAEEQASPALRAALLDGVRPPLASARALHTREEFDGVRAKLAEARAAHARAMIDALRETIMGKRASGFSDAEWKTLRADVTALLDRAGTDEERYERAHALYVGRAAERLAHAARKRAKEVDESARPDEEKKELKKRLADLAGTLEAAPDAGATASALARAQSDYRGVEARLAPAEVDEASWVPGGIPSPAPEPAAVEPRSAAELQRTLRSYDGAVTGVILVVAVISGVQVLWTGDATWGDFDSRLLAFLWGLGLHQVGHVPFQSLLGLRERFSRDD